MQILITFFEKYGDENWLLRSLRDCSLVAKGLAEAGRIQGCTAIGEMAPPQLAAVHHPNPQRRMSSSQQPASATFASIHRDRPSTSTQPLSNCAPSCYNLLDTYTIAQYGQHTPLALAAMARSCSSLRQTLTLANHAYSLPRTQRAFRPSSMCVASSSVLVRAYGEPANVEQAEREASKIVQKGKRVAFCSFVLVSRC